ncbi:MAG: flagellar biosynthesis protein FlhA [Nitrospirota bacterium]|nr:flagellar biosynthesis protein FlhA [Nitrospirota bacterium]
MAIKGQAPQKNLWQAISQAENVLAMCVFAIVVLLFVPAPPILIDLFLCFSIALAVLVLLVSFYILRPLDFSIFPTLLLIITLFRLSLSVAATRRILLFGNSGPSAAGEVIRAFGEFVVGGNYVTGVIIFGIIVTINFVVITKGAQRIAEVAARFILDAMPGKQMSIDADLNAGLITEEEARKRRTDISKEADFYGAMDGASKFIRGDAVASLIILAIAILGGISVGVLMQGLDLGTALRTYTLLSVGEGLLAQIPALIVSVGAGVVITRSATPGGFAGQMVSQLLASSRALGLGALILALLGLIPGLPKLPFLVVAAAMAYLAFRIYSRERSGLPDIDRELPKEEETPESMLAFDLLSVEVGLDLIPLVDVQQGGQLLPRVRAMRKELAKELGVIVPSIHIKDNLTLGPREYKILLKEVEIGKGEAWPNMLLAMNPSGGPIELEGIETLDPAFGLQAKWIRPGLRTKAKDVGMTVVEPDVVLVTHLSELIKQYAHEILDIDQVQALLNGLRTRFPRLVEELVPTVLSYKQLEMVLKGLLREGVSIYDMHTILETLSERAGETKDVGKLTEAVRQSLGRRLVGRLVEQDKALHVLSIDPEFDDFLTQNLRTTEQGEYLALDPQLAKDFIQAIDQNLGMFASLRREPVLLTSTAIRPHIRKILERFIRRLHVISYNEVPPEVKLQVIGQIKVPVHA